jgi:hypothetical protein
VRDCTIITYRLDSLLTMAASRQPVNDRRSEHRYPVKVALKYTIVLPNRKVVTGIGGTVNMSSGGILVQTADFLPKGIAIQLFIAWPARLNNTVALKLHVIGQTVRKLDNCTAVAIDRHEFRSSGMPIQ